MSGFPQIASNVQTIYSGNYLKIFKLNELRSTTDHIKMYTIWIKDERWQYGINKLRKIIDEGCNKYLSNESYPIRNR